MVQRSQLVLLNWLSFLPIDERMVCMIDIGVMGRMKLFEFPRPCFLGGLTGRLSVLFPSILLYWLVVLILWWLTKYVMYFVRKTFN